MLLTPETEGPRADITESVPSHLGRETNARATYIRTYEQQK